MFAYLERYSWFRSNVFKELKENGLQLYKYWSKNIHLSNEFSSCCQDLDVDVSFVEPPTSTYCPSRILRHSKGWRRLQSRQVTKSHVCCSPLKQNIPWHIVSWKLVFKKWKKKKPSIWSILWIRQFYYWSLIVVTSRSDCSSKPPVLDLCMRVEIMMWWQRSTVQQN